MSLNLSESIEELIVLIQNVLNPLLKMKVISVLLAIIVTELMR